MKLTISLFALLSTLLLFTNCNEKNYQETSNAKKAAEEIVQVEEETTQAAMQSLQIVDGKCYQQCLITGRYLTEFEDIAIFTGHARNENVDLEHRIIETPSRDKDAPNDAKQYILLKDTTQSSNFIIRKIFVYREVTAKDKYTTKRVLCEKELTSTLIGNVQQKLRDNGYYVHPTNTSVMDEETVLALSEFKKAYKLSCGDQLDIETLQIMGISSEKGYREYNW